MPDQSILDLFDRKLYLRTVPTEYKMMFVSALKSYLQHGRKDGEIKGRTYDYIAKSLAEFNRLFDLLGFTRVEQLQILTNDFSLLNNLSNFYRKYLFLGIIENEENTFRRKKILTKTKDFRVSFSKMYARYLLMCDVGYENICWNNIVHASDKEFCSIFVQNAYSKSYQIFENVQSVMDKLNEYDVDSFDLEVYKSMDVNEEFVSMYESKSR